MVTGKSCCRIVLWDCVVGDVVGLCCGGVLWGRVRPKLN